MTKRDYLVVSPEVGVMIPVLDDGSGPIEYGRDVALVRTSLGPREAKVAAVALWRRGLISSDWIHDAECPFAGVTVEPYQIDEVEEEFWEWELGCP